MTDWVKRPDIDSEADEDTVVWLAVRQLQREVDALKTQAAPTPVEDEVTPEMCAAASRTWDKQTSWSSAATWTAVYRAMRAAAAPEDEVTEAEREAGVQAVWKNFPGLTIFGARTVADAIISAMRAARVPAPTPEPSAELAAQEYKGNSVGYWYNKATVYKHQLGEYNEAIKAAGGVFDGTTSGARLIQNLGAELAALRARCERLRDYALAEYAYVELLERGHTERIPGTMAKTSRWVSEAHDKLQPGDLAALGAAEEGR